MTQEMTPKMTLEDIERSERWGGWRGKFAFGPLNRQRITNGFPTVTRAQVEQGRQEEKQRIRAQRTKNKS